MFNWLPGKNGKAAYQVAELDKPYGPTQAPVGMITEYRSQGPGDQWYCDVFCIDGHAERIFNVNKITYAPILPDPEAPEPAEQPADPAAGGNPESSIILP